MGHWYKKLTGERSDFPQPGWLPSVSTILGVTRSYADQLAINSWYAANLYEATVQNALAIERGNQIDAWAKAYLLRQALPDVHLQNRAWTFRIQPYLDLLLAQGEIKLINQPVFHRLYAGEPDLVIQMPMGLTVLDFKTRSRPPLAAQLLEARLQCTAYAEAYSHQFKEQVTQLSVVVVQPTFLKAYSYGAHYLVENWNTRLNAYLSSQTIIENYI